MDALKLTAESKVAYAKMDAIVINPNGNQTKAINKGIIRDNINSNGMKCLNDNDFICLV